MIMHLYIEEEVFKTDSLSISLTSNTFLGHRIVRILTPIENLWDMVERRIGQHSHLPPILQNLKSCIANAWYSLDVNALQKLVDSMPKRIRADIRVKGAPIKY